MAGRGPRFSFAMLMTIMCVAIIGLALSLAACGTGLPPLGSKQQPEVLHHGPTAESSLPQTADGAIADTSKPQDDIEDAAAPRLAGAVTHNAATPDAGKALPVPAGSVMKPVSSNSVTRIGSIITMHNIAYSHAGGHPILLDAYLPESGVHPAVVMIHGGGWAYGGKYEMVWEGQHLAEAGFAAFALDYRMAPPGGGWHAPTALTDVQSAVDWVRANASTYRVNRLKVGVLGASAGGNLAMMLGTNGQPGGDRVSVVVSWSGQSDLPLLNTHHTVNAATNYLGCSYKVCPQRWEENSPINHVSAETSPMLLCNSKHELMPLNQATTMGKKLAAAKIPYELDILNGDQHARSYATTAWTPTVAFLKKYLQ